MAGDGHRYALGVLTAVFAVNQLDRNILAITLEQIGAEFSLSDTQLGLLSGALFAVVYVTFGFPVAWMAARGSRRNIIAAAVAIWSALTIAMAGAQTFVQLALARLGVAVGEAGAVAPAHSMIADLYPNEKRTSAMATFAAGSNVGVLLAFLVGGIAGQALGWRWAFVIAGVPGLALALLLRFTVTEPARAGRDAADGAPLFGATLRTIWNDSGLFHAMCGIAVTGVVTFGALTWNAAFIIRAFQLSQAQTGIYLALTIGVLGGIGTWVSGLIADRLAEAGHPRWRLGVVVVAIVAAKPFIAGFLLLPSTIGALACVAVSASLATVFWGPTYAFLHSRVEPRMRPMATAIFLFVFNIVGVGIGPTVIGFASETVFAAQGTRSLGYAILVVQIAGIWGAWHYWRAARTIA
ncbi:MAG: MFS transporter [Rhizobiaceae bacterium]|nr:MFS transporter [Rhizobiaceae bacterium]